MTARKRLCFTSAGECSLALSEFDIQYQPVKAVKGQAFANLIAERINTNITTLSVRAWAMYFDV
jgi:Tfp pilus assembly ATPase PilU